MTNVKISAPLLCPTPVTNTKIILNMIFIEMITHQTSQIVIIIHTDNNNDNYHQEGGRPKPAARSKNRERRERLAKVFQSIPASLLSEPASKSSPFSAYLSSSSPSRPLEVITIPTLSVIILTLTPQIDYSDSDSDSSSAERPLKKPGAVRKARKRPVAKAVATPVVPPSMPNPIARYIRYSSYMATWC